MVTIKAHQQFSRENQETVYFTLRSLTSIKVLLSDKAAAFCLLMSEYRYRQWVY